MGTGTAVKEAIKESLVGAEEPVQLSVHTRARFNTNALKDPETGEMYMGGNEFINAIAPEEEDYVRAPPNLCGAVHFRRRHRRNARILHNLPYPQSSPPRSFLPMISMYILTLRCAG